MSFDTNLITNYINQFKTTIMQDENFHCMPDNEQTSTQEQSILSIEDRAKKFIENEGIGSGTNIGTNTLKWCMKRFVEEQMQERDNQLLPIIKELGEALKKAQNKYINPKRTWMGGDIVNLDYEEIKTILDKYKNYLVIQ